MKKEKQKKKKQVESKVFLIQALGVMIGQGPSWIVND